MPKLIHILFRYLKKLGLTNDISNNNIAIGKIFEYSNLKITK